MDTLLLHAATCLEHDPGPGHPENAGRLKPALSALRDADGVRWEEARPAARADLTAVHSEEHVRRLEDTAGRFHVQLDPDTGASARSWEAALLAAGATVEAAEAVLADRARGALAMVRPPGHHAEADRPMGFCLVNNVAVAAKAALARGGCRRILVLDPDVHHGNGTQAIFWDRPEVLYVSSHRFPFYPGTGAADEVGVEAGAGFTINLPLPAGVGDDALAYLHRVVVEPIVDEWEPDLVLVSAGFDTWKDDPLGGMTVTERGYAELFGRFTSWAERHCSGRIAATLEGGYDPAGVLAGSRALLRAMRGEFPPEAAAEAPRPAPRIREIAQRVMAALAPHWRCHAGH